MHLVADVMEGSNMTNVMGYDIPFMRYDGIHYNFWSFIPDNITEHLQSLRDTEIWEDDVFICTYPRSGTNWTHEIVDMLLKGKASYRNTLFEYIDMYSKERIEEFKSPRLFGSHFPLKYLPKQLEKKGRVICVFRNPKDLAVSFHNFFRKVKFADYNGKWDEFFQIILNGDLPGGSWFDHILGWEKNIAENNIVSVLPLFYEDIKRDLQSNVEKIAHFLGLPHNVELFSAIATKCSFPQMYEEKQINISPLVFTCSKDKTNYMYRKGEVGNWKKWFTVAQNEKFDHVYNERMKDSKLIFKFSL